MRKFVDARVSATFNTNVSAQHWSGTIGFYALDKNKICVRLPAIKGLRPIGRTLTFDATSKGMMRLLDALHAHEKEMEQARPGIDYKIDLVKAMKIGADK